jgi:tRNA modification GTPase
VRSLREAGLIEAREVEASDGHPEAKSIVEARMLDVLARAASPLAVDLLLDQPRRWESAAAKSDAGLDKMLDRLVDPALVVAMGPANVGKSTLVNALAGRAVAIVADEPGTTRDHVGVLLDLGGVVVRYLDTPGIRETGDAIEREAQEIAVRAAEAADLIVLLGDTSSPEPDRVISAARGTAARLTVALRSDLGVPAWKHELAVSAKTGAGIAALVARMREAIVPTAALEDARPWRFWKDPATPTTRMAGSD